MDCTLRDGGFLNDWNFTDEFAREAFLHCKNANYIEVGYKMHTCSNGFGKFAKCNDNEISNLFASQSTKLAVMVDMKNSDINDFANSQNSPITAVRVTCHYHEVTAAIEFCQKLKLMGYEVFLNLTSILRHKDFEILEKWQNKQILEAIYFADSFGNLSPSDVEKYYQILNQIGFGQIGFHAHNSAQDKNLALKNAKRAIELGAYIIDVSQGGIGRGAGNLSYANLADLQSIK